MTRVLCVGVAVIDMVMNLAEMPSKPEKYRARDAALVGGGCAATAAVAVARLGGRALLAGRLGQDAIGELIVGELESEGVDCTLLRRFSGRRSSFSSVFVDDHGERQIVNFRDTELPDDPTWLIERLPDFDVALADTHWSQGAAAVMAAARVAGKPGVLDAETPSRGAEGALRAGSHVAFSAQGLRAFAATRDLGTGLELAAARLGGLVAVTDGARGVFWHEGGQRGHEPGFAVDSVDSLGAGDVWHGAFALALGEGQSLRSALRFANASAAIKCTRPGGRAGAPSRAEVTQFLKERDPCN